MTYDPKFSEEYYKALSRYEQEATTTDLVDALQGKYADELERLFRDYCKGVKPRYNDAFTYTLKLAVRDIYADDAHRDAGEAMDHENH